MPVLVHNKGADWTQELYDAIFSLVIPDPAKPPAGLIAHYSAPGAGGGWQVVDVWKSEADFQRFAEEVIFPAAKEVGAPPFDTTIVELHNSLVP